MAAAHDNLIPYLSGTSGKAFVKCLTQEIYDWAFKVPVEYYNYRVFTEVSIRKETGEKTRLGLDRMKHYRFDAIFFIQPGNRALNQRQCYTCGVELKNSKSDLMHDEKMEEYLGYTDFFFIGVPANLVDNALERAGGNDHIGVMNLENGEIIKLPERNEITETHRIEILEQILYNTLFNEIKSVVFKVDEVEVVEPRFKTPDRHVSSESQDQSSRGEELQLQKEELTVKMEEARKSLPPAVAKTVAELPVREQRVYNMIHEASVEGSGSAEGSEGIQVKDIVARISEFGGSPATIKRQISELKDKGLIVRKGSKKKGSYIVNPDFVCELSCSACARAGECPDFIKLDKAQNNEPLNQ